MKKKCQYLNFKRPRRETVECLYVTVKFAVVPPTLGLRSCQGGVRGLVEVRLVQEETSLVELRWKG